MKFLSTLLLTFFVVSLFAQNETEILTDGIIFPRLTNLERDLLTPVQGHCIYNIDEKEVQCYDGISWEISPSLNAPKLFPAIYSSIFPGGISVHDMLGNSTNIISSAFTFEIMGEYIYTQELLNGDIVKHDLDGNVISQFDPTDAGVSYYLDFVAIPDGRFALLDNQNDDIYILDNDGTMIQTLAIPNAHGSYQNISGIVVGDYLIVSENGNKELVYVNLDTYEIGIFKDLSAMSGPYLSDLDYANNTFYITTSSQIFSFTLTGTPELITTLPQGNITGIKVSGNIAYVVNNGSDSLYEVDLTQGTFSEFITGFTSNPRDIAIR